MCAVLRNDLEWEETSCDFSSHFVGKELVECVVYQDEDVSACVISLGMTLADQQGGQDVVKLRACSHCDPAEHYIIHAFLTDPKTGCVIKEFPLHHEILGVSSVWREEKGRSRSCCGHTIDHGCFVSGLKFTFGSSEHVILHCWTGCKPVPCCGDPTSPSYVPSFMVSSGELQGKRSSFLPPDFLGHIGCGDGFCAFDASGMLLAGTSRGKSLRYSKDVFDCVKLQFGLGKWEPGPFWKFREAHSGQRMIQLSYPESRDSALSLGFGSFFPVKWKEIFKKVEEGLDDCLLLHGKYDIDLSQMQPSRIISKELNAAVDMLSLSLSPSLTFPVTMSHLILSKFLLLLNGPPEAQAISVRFTDGNSLLGGILASPPRSFKSRVQHGCQGGSLGFHLVESSELRKVITLHGAVEDLISDLELTCAGAELELCKGLIRDGKASQVLGMRCSRHGYSSRSGEEVMSMRIANPSVHALIGCSMIMPDGQVQYDPKTKAFYPVTWDGGNVRRDAACALILGILKAMKACKDSLDLIPSVIRMRSVN